MKDETLAKTCISAEDMITMHKIMPCVESYNKI